MDNEIQNFILMINGPIKKFVKQQWECDDSACIDYTKFIGNSTLQTTYDVCSVCYKPYLVDYDISNISIIKNIGE